MEWGAVLLAVLQLVGSLISWASDTKRISAAQAEAIAKDLSEKADALRKAFAIRDALHDELVTHPERLRDNDGFKRPSETTAPKHTTG